MELYQEKFLSIIDTEENDFDFSHYLVKMRTLGTRGTNAEIVALSELYRRPVELYEGQTTPVTITSDVVDYNNHRPPFRISLNDCTVYFSVATKIMGKPPWFVMSLECLRIQLCFTML